MISGALVISVTLLSGLFGDDDGSSAESDLYGSHGLEPYDTGLADVTPPASLDETKEALNSLTHTASNPFATSSGLDNTVHKVVIKFTSDGGMYAGWLYRTKGGEGVKVAGKTLTVSKNVRGGLPVAKAGVRVLSTATYATCTIYVDGVAVVSRTARGENYITVCIG